MGWATEHVVNHTELDEPGIFFQCRQRINLEVLLSQPLTWREPTMESCIHFLHHFVLLKAEKQWKRSGHLVELGPTTLPIAQGRCCFPLSLAICIVWDDRTQELEFLCNRKTVKAILGPTISLEEVVSTLWASQLSFLLLGTNGICDL